MPHALKPLAPAAAPKRSLPAPIRSVQAHPSHRSTSSFFFVADLMFLTLVGIAATLTMHLIHELEWPFIPTSLIGMIAAMLVQTLMAFAAAPLLGSIESMVPSMIVGMVSPMTVCLLHLFGCESTWMMGAMIGSAFALGTFAFVQLYARSCRYALARHREVSRS